MRTNTHSYKPNTIILKSPCVFSLKSFLAVYFLVITYEMSNLHRHAKQIQTDQCLDHWWVSMFSILWSSEHKTAYVAYEKQKKERLTPCTSTDPEEESDTPVSIDNWYILFNTVYMAAKSEIPSNTVNQNRQFILL